MRPNSSLDWGNLQTRDPEIKVSGFHDDHDVWMEWSQGMYLILPWELLKRCDMQCLVNWIPFRCMKQYPGLSSSWIFRDKRSAEVWVRGRVGIKPDLVGWGRGGLDEKIKRVAISHNMTKDLNCIISSEYTGNPPLITVSLKLNDHMHVKVNSITCRPLILNLPT